MGGVGIVYPLGYIIWSLMQTSSLVHSRKFSTMLSDMNTKLLQSVLCDDYGIVADTLVVIQHVSENQRAFYTRATPLKTSPKGHPKGFLRV